MKNRALTAVLCILLTGLCLGCHQPSPGPSEPPSSKEDASSAVSAPSSPQPASSAADPVPAALLAGKTIAAVKNDDRGSVFILTGEKKVLYYGAYREGLEELTAISKTAQKDEKALFELSLPEPIVRIEPYAAVGESGALYLLLYPVTTAWTGNNVDLPKSLVKIPLEEPIKDICYHHGDFIVVLESGKVVTVGELTLYGQGFGELDRSRLLMPAAAVVPEAIEQAVSTEHTVFLRGKSGRVYAAFRFVNEGPDTHLPKIITDEFPYSDTASLFEPVDAGPVRSIAVGASERGGVVYLVRDDGSVWSWNADQETIEAYSPGYQSDKKPGKPEIAFSPLALQEKAVTDVVSTAYSSFACFLTQDGRCELLRYGKEAVTLPQTVSRLCLTPNGFLYCNPDGTLFFYGGDPDRLLTEKDGASNSKVPWLALAP